MYYILFLLLVPVLSQITQSITEPSVMMTKYYFKSNNQDARMSIIINNNKYRESTILPYQEGYFPVYFKTPGEYIINYEITGKFTDVSFENNLYNGELIYGNGNLKDKIITNEWIVLDTLTYYSDKKHMLDLYYMANFEKMYLDNLQLKILINNEDILETNIYSNYLTHHISIGKDFGYYQITILVMSNGTIRSRPSAKNGYNQNRYLVAVINKDTSRKEEIPTKKQEYITISNSIHIPYINTTDYFIAFVQYTH